MASERAKRAAAERLRNLDKEASNAKRNKLRAQVHMGSRQDRREAATKLSNMPRQRATARKIREDR